MYFSAIFRNSHVTYKANIGCNETCEGKFFYIFQLPMTELTSLSSQIIVPSTDIRFGRPCNFVRVSFMCKYVICNVLKIVTYLKGRGS